MKVHPEGTTSIFELTYFSYTVPALYLENLLWLGIIVVIHDVHCFNQPRKGKG